MVEVKNGETKTNLMTLFGVFVVKFEKYITVVNLFPVDFAVCLRVLVADFENC